MAQKKLQKLTVVLLVKEVYGRCGTEGFYGVLTKSSKGQFFIKLNP
jgi:hypothetical protein